jgi:hypothetical protein
VRQGRGGGQESSDAWREEKHEKGAWSRPAGDSAGGARDAACPHRGGTGVADMRDPATSGRGRVERGTGACGPTWEKAEWTEPE